MGGLYGQSGAQPEGEVEALSPRATEMVQRPRSVLGERTIIAPTSLLVGDESDFGEHPRRWSVWRPVHSGTSRAPSGCNDRPGNGGSKQKDAAHEVNSANTQGVSEKATTHEAE